MQDVSSQISNQQILSQLTMNTVFVQQLSDASQKIASIPSDMKDSAFSKEDDENHKETTDNEHDISFAEYLKECEQNAKTPNYDAGITVIEKDEDSIVKPINIGKAMNAYTNTQYGIPESKISGVA